MKLLSREFASTFVRHFTHGLPDPETGLGCQRESVDDLGFGWIYFALARATEAKRALVVGSGRGFSAACLALGMEKRPTAEVILVDPGYEQWTVDGVTSDIAPGLWRRPEQAQRHFAQPLNLRNIRVMPLRSDEAFDRFRSDGSRFDLIVIDGDHGYRQCLNDLRRAFECLRSGGLILAHDAFSPRWPGVAFAIDTLVTEDPTLHRIGVPLSPGLALVQKSQESVTLRPVTAEENERVNAWRAEAGITTRPLPDGNDPRPGEDYDDPRIGLFGIFVEGELIGGFGQRLRTFSQPGADDFLPDCGWPLHGFLSYGLVIRPESRNQGYMRIVRQQRMRWFAAEGYYGISHFHRWSNSPHLRVERVGTNGSYTAYHFRLQPMPGDRSVRCLAPMPWASRIEAEVRQLHLEPLQRRLHDLTGQLAAAQAREEALATHFGAVINSKSWRWTYPARMMGRWVRGIVTRIMQA